ncbi:MAG: MBL fold metallo-hydrolase [Bacteroidota bacterium]
MPDSSTWRVKFYGTRGSIPVCDPEFQIYGGNTTCIMVDLLEEPNRIIGIIDAGTGIRRLGQEIISGLIPVPDQIYLIFTHFHWDHIQGFPFFAPAYNRQQKISLVTPGLDQKEREIRKVFETQMQEVFFPVQLEDMGVDFEFLVLNNPGRPLNLQKIDRIETLRNNHPGGSNSYRFDAMGKSVVICTDIEHGQEIDERVIRFSEGADLLVHDAQYTDEELATHRGWGHSSYSQAIEVAERAGVKQLIMTHHDPDHDDDFLFRIEQECQDRFPNCKLAKEGLEIWI